MKKIASLLLFCCLLIFIGGLLLVNAGTQQKSSANRKGKKMNNQEKVGENRQKMNKNQQQTTPPVCTPEELAYFQNLINLATNNGMVRYKGNSSYKNLTNLAENSLGSDLKNYRSDFINLVGKAKHS